MIEDIKTLFNMLGAKRSGDTESYKHLENYAREKYPDIEFRKSFIVPNTTGLKKIIEGGSRNFTLCYWCIKNHDWEVVNFNNFHKNEVGKYLNSIISISTNYAIVFDDEKLYLFRK